MNVAIYARYSSDNQRVESIDAQLRICRAYCTKKGYTIVKEYADEAISGKIDKRPKFMELVSDSESSIFEKVIFHKIDRNARDESIYYIWKKHFNDLGIDYEYAEQNIDNSAEGSLLESIMVGVAAYHSRNLSKEVMKGLNENARRGMFNGGKIPLGYNINSEGFYEINKSESPIIEMMFKLFLDGNGYAKIASLLNQKGYRNKEGKEFSKTTIRDYLINEKFAGIYIYNRGTHAEIKVIDGLPAIICQADYDNVMKIINGRKFQSSNARREYVLKGYIECGYCKNSYVGGGKYSGKSTSSVVYRCHTRNAKKSDGCDNKALQQDYIENFVLTEIQNTFFTDVSIEFLCDKVEKQSISSNNKFILDRDRIDKAIKSEESKLSRLKNGYLHGIFSESEVKTSKTVIDKSLAALQIEKSSLISKTNLYSRESIKEYLNSMRQNLNSQNAKIKRKVIETFLEKIYVFKDRVEVVLKLPSPEPYNSGSATGNRTPA